MPGITPIGDKLAALRKAKGYATQSHLARGQKFSTRTVARAEASQSVSVESLKMIVKTLTGSDTITDFISNTDLITSESSQPEWVNLAIRLMTTMDEHLKRGGTGSMIIDWKNRRIIIDDVLDDGEEQGSVIIHLRVTKDDAKRIFDTFFDGFEEYAVESVTVSLTVYKTTRTIRVKNFVRSIPQLIRSIFRFKTDDGTAIVDILNSRFYSLMHGFGKTFIGDAMDNLPFELKEVFDLYYKSAWSVDQLAAKYDKPPSAIIKDLDNARLFIEDFIEKRDFKTSIPSSKSES